MAPSWKPATDKTRSTDVTNRRKEAIYQSSSESLAIKQSAKWNYKPLLVLSEAAGKPWHK